MFSVYNHNHVLKYLYFRRNSKIRMSARSFATEVPLQVSCTPGSISVKTQSVTFYLLTSHFVLLFVCLVLELVIKWQREGFGLPSLGCCVYLPNAQPKHCPTNGSPTSSPAFAHTEPVSDNSPEAASFPTSRCQNPQPSEGWNSQGCYPISLHFSRCPR